MYSDVYRVRASAMAKATLRWDIDAQSPACTFVTHTIDAALRAK